MCEGVDAAAIMVDWETMLRVREPTATSWRFPTKTALYCDFTTTEGDRGRLDLAEGDCDWVTRRAEAGVFGRADLLEGACLVGISEVFVHRFRFNPYTRFGVFVHPGDRRA